MVIFNGNINLFISLVPMNKWADTETSVGAVELPLSFCLIFVAWFFFKLCLFFSPFMCDSNKLPGLVSRPLTTIIPQQAHHNTRIDSYFKSSFKSFSWIALFVINAQHYIIFCFDVQISAFISLKRTTSIEKHPQTKLKKMLNLALPIYTGILTFIINKLKIHQLSLELE